MPYQQFTLEERIRLEALLRADLMQKDIARELQRDPGSISREINLNRHPSGKYLAHYAHKLSKQRRCKANQSHRKIIAGSWLEKYIREKS